MKKLSYKWLVLVMGVLAIADLQAQMTSGMVVYEMEMKSADEQMQAQLDMMSGSEMTLIFDEENYNYKMSTPFYISETRYNAKEAKGLQLNEGGGMKTAIFMTEEELDKANPNEESDEDPEIIYTEETMDINGYECKKVLIQSSEGEVVMWVTDKIDFKPQHSQFSNEKVKGFPMRIETEQDRGGMKMTVILTVTSVKEKVKKKDPFGLTVPGGYEELTMEQYKARMKKFGMGQ